MENSTEVYSVRLKELADEFKLEVMFVPENYDELLIYSSAVNRPGLRSTGFMIASTTKDTAHRSCGASVPLIHIGR